MKPVIIAALCFLFYNPAQAEYNAFKLGEASGEYVYSTALLNALKESPCGYISIQEKPIQNIIRELKQHLSPSDVLDLSKFVSEKETKAKVDIKNVYKAYRKGMDEKTACGALFQNILILQDKGLKKWEHVKKYHSYK